MTPSDVDAILSQLAEGHWPRPTAELGRAIVERIREAEAENERLSALQQSHIADLLRIGQAGIWWREQAESMERQRDQAFKDLAVHLAVLESPAAGEGGTGE